MRPDFSLFHSYNHISNHYNPFRISLPLFFCPMALYSSAILLLQLFFYFLVTAAASGSKEIAGGVRIWPLPVSVTHGAHRRLYVAKDFRLNTQGSNFSDASGILEEGFSRLLDVVRVAHVVDANLTRLGSSALLLGIHIVVSSSSDEVYMILLILFLSVLDLRLIWAELLSLKSLEIVWCLFYILHRFSACWKCVWCFCSSSIHVSWIYRRWYDNAFGVFSILFHFRTITVLS